MPKKKDKERPIANNFNETQRRCIAYLSQREHGYGWGMACEMGVQITTLVKALNWLELHGYLVIAGYDHREGRWRKQHKLNEYGQLTAKALKEEGSFQEYEEEEWYIGAKNVPGTLVPAPAR